ncbi:flavin reductase family protein [Streptomyces sp. NPDC019531]|uniref:flavin reductase family protein n=1 Tax=Streptomyces sp. NPDC019531 TaxID=3365062 RepID=UPI00384B39B4
MTRAVPDNRPEVRAATPATRFRDAMATFPSGVTIVTTADWQGRQWGFTATSFCSLSLDPPLVLVCLAKDAQCHPAFAEADSWVVHVLGTEHSDLALRFATKGVDKFSTAVFHESSRGHPVLADAGTVLECDTYDRHDAGDHTILVGRVHEARLNPMTPAVYFRRAFHPVPAHPSAGHS